MALGRVAGVGGPAHGHGIGDVGDGIGVRVLVLEQHAEHRVLARRADPFGPGEGTRGVEGQDVVAQVTESDSMRQVQSCCPIGYAATALGAVLNEGL
ncbi:hypothetical protein AB0E04_23705 [Streptomyces sp. NPDC048251]|uniref:hypothetical protein n=1 Tax=Streptomyces sp. NPDC048251 TaxID=3154501 RepID=UPI00343ADC14